MPWIATHNEAEPRRPANLVKRPKTPDTTPISPRAPPIATKPRQTSSQDISPNFLNASANLLSPNIIISMVTLPKRPVHFSSLVIMLENLDISSKAPPIATKPRPISPQDISPNLVKASANLFRPNIIISIVMLPKSADHFPNLVMTLEILDISSKATPIATNPRVICSQDIAPNLVKASANLFRPNIIISMVTPPKSADHFPNLVIVLENLDTSSKATPIATNPRVICSQDIAPNLVKASANLLSPNTIISIDIAFNNPNFLFKYLVTATSSAKAPPIAAKPLAIAPQVISPNFLRASPKILQALAKAIIDILVWKGIFILSIAFMPLTNINNPAPTPTMPLATALNCRFPIFSMAFAKVLIAVAINISENEAPIKPLPLPSASFLFIALNVFVNITNNTPTADNDFIKPATFISDIFLRADDSMPIATAIATTDVTLIPLVKDCKVSFTEPNISLKVSATPLLDSLSPFLPPNINPIRPSSSNVSLIFETSLANFIATLNMPPPTKPAKISVAVMFSDIHPNTVFMVSQISPTTLGIVLLIFVNMFPNPFTFSVALFMTSEMIPAIFEKLSEILVVSKFSSRVVKKSPADAAASKNKLTKFFNPSDPIN